MLAMNNEGFPLFKRTCSAQILSMACFPGLGPSVRHAPVCSSIKSWLSAGPTSPREKALFLYAEMTANLPHTRKLLHSPRHPLLAYSEVTLPGLSAGPGGRGRGGLLLWALKKCLLNGYLIVYTFFLPYYRSTFTRSPVSVSSLLETFFGSCPGLLGVGEQGGALGGSLGSQAVRELPVHL